MGSKATLLHWTLLLCLSHLCEGVRAVRDAYLQSLSEKCEQGSDSRQSYYSHYCFQYNALTNIHNLLAFGEELLQIGPIDLITLKSIPSHLKASAADIPPVIVYPENSAEKLLQAAKKQMKDEDTESNMVKIGNKKFTGRDRVRKSMIGNSTRHVETKRDVAPPTHPTGIEVDYYVKQKDGDRENSNGKDEKKIDYYYSLEDTLNEDFKDLMDSDDYDEGEMESLEMLTKNREIFRTNLIRNMKKPNKEDSKSIKINREHIDSDVKTTENTDDVINNSIKSKSYRNRPKEVSATIGTRSSESGNEQKFTSVLPAIVSLDEVGIQTRVVPESRALLKNLEERQKINLMRRKEERYFLNNEDLMSSSDEDLNTENSRPSLTPLPLQLHRPISTFASVNPHQLEAPSGPNMDHLRLVSPNTNHQATSTSNPNMAHQLAFTNGPNIHHNHQLVTSSNKNLGDTNSRDSSDEPMEPRIDDQTRTLENNSEWNAPPSEESDSNEKRRTDNRLESGQDSNGNEKEPLGDGNHNASNGKEGHSQSQSHFYEVSTIKSDDFSKQNVNHQIGIESLQHVNAHSQNNHSQHVNSHGLSFNTVLSSVKAMEGVVPTSWLSHLDEIARQLSDIFSTYGITVPIPDWSEGLPAIIPLEEGREKGKDPSVSRRRTNKHSSTKKYMALFPLVAVLKFMVIKALLIPLLISVLIIKKIIILGVIAMPYVFSLLRVCRNGPGFGFLMGGGAGGGGGLGGNQVAANAPYLSAVDTAVDYTGGYGHAASYKDFGGGARWMDRHYPNMMAPGGKQAGEVGLIER